MQGCRPVALETASSPAGWQTAPGSLLHVPRREAHDHASV